MSTAPRQVTHELRFTQVASGARIAWARSGRLGGPVLVRMGQWMTHVEHDLQSTIWRPWLEALGRTLEVVRYDERGCGLSGQDSLPLTLESAVEDLAAVVTARGAPKVALLGISGSVPAALVYAARYPERVSRLILLGGYTHGLMHREPTPDTAAYLEARVRLIELGWARADPAVQAFFTSTMLPEASAAETASLNEQQRLSCDGAQAARILRARTLLDARDDAPRVQAPTLVLHCAGDQTVPVKLGHELTAAIPGARFEALDSRNHIPLASSPCFARFCELVSEFVNVAPEGPSLTPRERELTELVAQGLDNLQIAARLGVADKTVRNALSALYVKLAVEGRPQAIVRARDLGFGRT